MGEGQGAAGRSVWKASSSSSWRRTRTTARPPQWYVNGQGQTMVVIPGPVEFVMGSPTTEAGREPR